MADVMLKPVRVLLPLVCCVALARAQPSSVSPLVGERATPAASLAGGSVVAEDRADSALQSGFPGIATTFYRQALADPALPAEARYRVTLSLVTALLDSGETAAAERELANYTGPKDSTFQLRTGLVAAHARRLGAARTALGEVNEEDLPPVERGWWIFLQAQIAEIDGDFVRAADFYERAVQASISSQQRARFSLAQVQAQLRVRPPSESDLATMYANMNRYAGQRLGFQSARAYAAALAMLDRRAEAQAVLQRQLAVVPAAERNEADQFRLLLGSIAGESSAEGRRAFQGLLRDALRPDTQRTALYALNRGAKTPADREQLRQVLTELINAATIHPVIEDLLLVRAQAALADGLYPAADDSARMLLDRYPGSPLKAEAIVVRLSVAWEQKRFRMAAELASQLRTLLPPGAERSNYAVLLAEAFFRAATLSGSAGDYQSAADAYEAALHEAPQVKPTGELIFQRVLSDVRAGRIAEAARQLDEMAGNTAFDVVNRWQAEWNLIREMQVRNMLAEAKARVDKLVSGTTAGVPDELKVRLLWLRAKLSHDNGQHDAAVQQADALWAELAKAQLDPALKSEVASTAQLLKAQSLLALKRDAEGEALLNKLRAEHAGSKAALYSYIVQADRQAQRGEFASAQKTLVDMADANPTSEFAPLALYQASLYAERQGLNRNLEEAYKLLERIPQRYPNNEFVFHARLRQGDLLRLLNDFGAARNFYQSLLNDHAQHPDVLLAHLRWGDTLFAQGANNPDNYAEAAAVFERLRDLPAAPTDLRIEAGHKWGYTLLRRGQTVEAIKVWWSVIDNFLLDPSQAANLGPNGRYWIPRTLLQLGEVLEGAGNFDEAQRAYRLIIDHGFDGSHMAESKLARYRVSAGGAP